MARYKPIVAISLALALLISPVPAAFADGPPVLRTDGGTQDGHPWDDGTTESDPGLNPNTLTQQVGVPVEVVSAAATAFVPAHSGASFVSGVIRIALHSWFRTFEVRSAKRQAVGLRDRR